MYDTFKHPHGFTISELYQEAQISHFHPALRAKLRWLADDGHLSGIPRGINNVFGALAIQVAVTAPQSPETTVAVTKLVEAKDAAIRAWVDTKIDTKEQDISGVPE